MARFCCRATHGTSHTTIPTEYCPASRFFIHRAKQIYDDVNDDGRLSVANSCMLRIANRGTHVGDGISSAGALFDLPDEDLDSQLRNDGNPVVCRIGLQSQNRSHSV
jgi:hypothetical protein